MPETLSKPYAWFKHGEVERWVGRSTAAVLTALGCLWMIIVHGGRLKNLSADVHGV